MKTEKIIVPVASFVAGAAIGCAVAYGLSPMTSAGDRAELVELMAERLARENADVHAKLAARDREIARLRSRPRRTERREEAVDEPAAEPVAGPDGEAPVAAPDRRGFLERMRTENPEEYARMTNGWAQARQAWREREQSRLDFFDSIDLSVLDADDRAKAEEFQNLVVRRGELEARMGAGPGAAAMTDEERRALFEELRATHEAIGELGTDVRDVLVRQTALTLGLDAETSDAVAATVAEIIEATGNSFGGPRGPGFRRGGGRGGFGRGR